MPTSNVLRWFWWALLIILSYDLDDHFTRTKNGVKRILDAPQNITHVTLIGASHQVTYTRVARRWRNLQRRLELQGQTPEWLHWQVPQVDAHISVFIPPPPHTSMLAMLLVTMKSWMTGTGRSHRSSINFYYRAIDPFWNLTPPLSADLWQYEYYRNINARELSWIECWNRVDSNLSRHIPPTRKSPSILGLVINKTQRLDHCLV